MNEQHLRLRSGRTNAFYGIMAWIHTLITYRPTHTHTHTHTHTITTMAILLSLFLSLSPSPPSMSHPQLDNRRRPIEQSSGAGAHSIISRWNKSHFSLSSLLSPFCLFFCLRLTPLLESFPLFLSLSLFISFLSSPAHLYHISSPYTLSLSSSLLPSLLSVGQVIPSASSSGQTWWPTAF